ncbi:hypothetical protein CPLU01_03106 [Colletotrichum plurivorum]|uniref:Uncharacterized protein n=1 Tax=Colletotrichum plurivorum TaxID=2175906 RepID=A0A8H6NKZ2_9PEZI|nr:hypothetical protein CPLU01_03106 [Colletotrichum plurivorum]
MSRRSSNPRPHQQRRASRRASAPVHSPGYPPQASPSERQLARQEAVDVPREDRDPDYYADEEGFPTDNSQHVPIPPAYDEYSAYYAQFQPSSYPPVTYRSHQPWGLPRSSRTTPNAHVSDAYAPDTYINEPARNFGEVSDPALQDLEYLSTLSPLMSPTSTTAQPASMSPKNSFVGMGAWDTLTGTEKYPTAPTDLREIDYREPNLGTLPDRSLRSDSTEAIRPSRYVN